MLAKRVSAIIALCLITLLVFGCNLLPQRKPQGHGSGGGERTKVVVSMGITAMDKYALLKSQKQ